MLDEGEPRTEVPDCLEGSGGLGDAEEVVGPCGGVVCQCQMKHLQFYTKITFSKKKKQKKNKKKRKKEMGFRLAVTYGLV